jgi:hypothetical protein
MTHDQFLATHNLTRWSRLARMSATELRKWYAQAAYSPVIASVAMGATGDVHAYSDAGRFTGVAELSGQPVLRFDEHAA